ncbi:MAG: nucleotidyl transferase AbiEii/AbiGii toxin family protein [Anaerolineales bacterium]
MKYTSGRAFRQVLGDRLKDIYHTENIPLVRLRKQVAFERFITRLLTIQPDNWILKGGLAMQLRLGIQSRTTKDIDLLYKELTASIYDSLVEAASLDIGDWFTFEVRQTEEAPQDLFSGHRYHVNCLLDGRVFEAFHVDVGVGDLLVEDYDCLNFDPILDFAGVAATEVPCYPITQQIAEKLHALTRKYASGGSSRAKDFVDILLLAGLSNIKGVTLSKAIQSTFEIRNTHPLPREMPELSKTLRREYYRLAGELDLEFDDFHDAENALANFINPVLVNNDLGMWDAENWIWA